MAIGFAIRLALIAFAAASIRGLLTQSDFQATIETAMFALAVFFGLGIITGELARRVVEESVLDEILIVSTPEPTSIADAYATIKLLSAVEIPSIQFLVNQADSSQHARAIIDRLQQTSRVFLHSDVGSSGYIPTDSHVVKAVAARTPFLVDTPHAPASRAVQQLARRMKNLTVSRLSTGGFFAKIRESLSAEKL